MDNRRTARTAPDSSPDPPSGAVMPGWSAGADRAGEALDPGQTAQFAVRSMLGLTALVASAVPFLGLSALVLNRWAPLSRLDDSVARALNVALASRPSHVRALEIASEIGGGATAGYLLTTAIVWLLIRRERRRATYLAVTGIGLAILVPVTKVMVGRPRPDLALPVVDLPSNPSFPSGHAMSSLVTWGALTILVLPMLRPSRRRIMVGVTALVVLLVGFTRLALGVHFVSDVLAGWALGGAWLALTYRAFRRWLRRGDDHAPAVPGRLAAAGMHLTPLPEPALPDGARTAMRLGVAALAVAAAVTVAGLLLTGPLAGRELQEWDTSVVARVAELRSPGATEVVDLVGRLGGLWGVVTVAVATAALAQAYRGSWRPVLFLVLAVIGEVVLYGVSSQIVGRARPDVPDLTSGLPVEASFPSGHVAAATVVYGALCLLVLHYGRGPWRWLLVPLVIAVVGATAGARIYVAAHHPTDTLAGALLGLLWLAALHRQLLRPRRTDTARATRGGSHPHRTPV